MSGPTPQQLRVLHMLRAYIHQHGYAPSLAEIGVEIGLASKSGVLKLLDGLEERGHIERMRNRKRAITLVENNPLNVTLDRAKLVKFMGDQRTAWGYPSVTPVESHRISDALIAALPDLVVRK